jgi:hypothetical protein
VSTGPVGGYSNSLVGGCIKYLNARTSRGSKISFVCLFINVDTIGQECSARSSQATNIDSLSRGKPEVPVVTSQRLDKSMIGVHSFVSHFEGTVYRTDRLQAKDNTKR